MIYTLEALRNEYLRGKRYKYLFFWGHTPSGSEKINESCLSQWWIQEFTIKDVVYSCAEQFMMAEKARLFDDDEMLDKIMKSKTPKEMKSHGRSIRNFDKNIWDLNCYNIVKTANLAKFSQNYELLEFLLGTQKRILVEASPIDQIWGIGLDKFQRDVENPMKWRGLNLLGFALTEVRDELVK